MMLFMYFVYVLKMSNGQIYTGFTNDLKKRLEKHQSGKVFTTSKYLPVSLVYYECYLSRTDALEREKMLKRYGSTWSHLKRRIADSFRVSQGRG